MNANPMQALTGILGKLNPKQKIMLGVGVVVTVALLFVLMTILNEPTYSTLYSGLSQEDAGKVVEHLNSQKVLFKIDDNGQSIKVQREKVAELRLTLAGKGIPSSGVIGYEIFDKSTMGMSEFMQNLNYRRALEGEIARTIQHQEGISWAKVLIVMPKRTIFREEEKQPTASVVIKLKNNSTPSKENIQAIVNLMCGSVEGLQPAKVSVIDTKGRILSNDAEEGPMAFASAKQYEIKKSVENHLVQKAQAILDNVLGFGNAMVQVNADINFDQVEKTMTQFDPESQVVVSEGIAKTASNGRQQSDTTSAANENAVTNYEISKTVRNVVEGTGNIKRLSVATVINDIPREVKEGNKTKIVFDPRPADQIKKLEELVKNAVGIDPTRNDQFTIVNIPFETKVEETTTEAGMSALPDANEYINLVFILVAIVSSLFVLKSLMKRLKNEKIVIGTVSSGNYAYASEPSSGSLPAHGESKSNGTQQLLGQKKKKMLLPMGDIEDEISDDALAKKNQQERIVNYVTKNPMDAAKLINAWMHEDEA